MVIRSSRFNIYLLLLAAVAISFTGCQSAKRKEEKQKATLRIHLETNPLPGGQSEVVTVLRSAPILISIERSYFLNETHIAEAKLVDSDEGFSLVLQFNQQGQHLLEQYSAANSRRRFAIRTQFRMGTNVFDRWIAAPLITGRISEGILAFTPDADRAEAEVIVRGWNNVAAETQPKKKKQKNSDKTADSK